MRADIVAAARGWLGTPYLHQASLHGAGADCLGLLRGVWREVYGFEPADVPAYTADWSEASGDERLWRAAECYLIVRPMNGFDPGDVVLFRMARGAVAKHLGIIATSGAHPQFIHAYRRHGVVENSFSEPWQRRVVARFGFPEH